MERTASKPCGSMMATYDRAASIRISKDLKNSTFEARYRSALESYLEPTADETQLIGLVPGP